MRKLIFIVHTSLDGYIANTDGSFDGLNPGSNNLDYVCSIAEDADTILAGRTTFQLLNTYWPDAFKNLKPAFPKCVIQHGTIPPEKLLPQQP